MKYHKTWWGESFVAALEGFIDSGRLSRGRAYCTDNRVLKFEHNGNNIKATVRGNINPYFGVTKEPRYKIDITFKRLPKKEWDEAIQNIGNNAAWLSKLMLNEIPDDINRAFSKGYLLPKSYQDVEASCSCPDWGDPCKHIAGIYYRLANILDGDPMMLFSLRGLSPKELIAKLKKTELGLAFSELLALPDKTELNFENTLFPFHDKPSKKIDSSQESFWEMGVIHEETANDDKDENLTISAALVKKQGDYPPFWNRQNSFLAVMENFYELTRKKNKGIFSF